MATASPSADAQDGINGEQKMLKIENASPEPSTPHILFYLPSHRRLKSAIR